MSETLEPTEAEQIVAELADSDPYRPMNPDTGADFRCQWCSMAKGNTHWPTCLWLRAQSKRPPIDTSNRWRVMRGSDGSAVVRGGYWNPSPERPLPLPCEHEPGMISARPEMAVNLAAHLLLVADPDGTAFEAFKEAVKRDG